MTAHLLPPARFDPVAPATSALKQSMCEQSRDREGAGIPVQRRAFLIGADLRR